MFSVQFPPPPACAWRSDEHRRRCGAPSRSTAATSSNPYKCENTLLTGGGEPWQRGCACYQKADFYCWECAKRMRSKRKERTVHVKRSAWEKRGGVKRHDPVVSFPPRLPFLLRTGFISEKAKIQIRVKKRD